MLRRPVPTAPSPARPLIHQIHDHLIKLGAVPSQPEEAPAPTSRETETPLDWSSWPKEEHRLRGSRSMERQLQVCCGRPPLVAIKPEFRAMIIGGAIGIH